MNPGRTIHRRRAFALLAARLLACALLPGCASVQPWERGVLARPHMALDPLPLRSSLRAHVQGSREAVPPAVAADGGGCGCY